MTAPLTPLLLRAPSNKKPLKFRSLNNHPGRYLEDNGIRKKFWYGKVSDKILIEIIFAQILTYLDYHGKLFDHNLSNLTYSAVVG